MQKLRIGFIGLGLMGQPMAKNILKKGFPLVVYNRTVSKTSELKKLGASVAKTPKELASEVDVVITMVTGPKDVKEVIFGKDGVVKGAKRGLVMIDMSTIGPQAAREINEQCKMYNIEFLDAPVTGSTPKAITGELTIFVGGEEKVLKKVRPILEAMGTTIHHVGSVGMGQAIKLVNNLIVGQTVVTLAETFLLGDKLGLSRKQVFQILGGVPAVSVFMKLRMPNMVDDNHKTLFSVSNLDKDLNLALNEVKKEDDLPLLKLVTSLFDKGSQDKKIKDQDISAIIKILEN